MLHIKPFPAWRPRPDLAAQVASVPYDVVDRAEAAAQAAGNPLSLLHVTRAEIDLPPTLDPYSETVYLKAQAQFAALRQQGVLIQDAEPCLYLYRQRRGDHVQHGVAVCCAVEDYERDLIKKHEKTRPDKEDDRTRHIAQVRAQTGPVFLLYRDQPEIRELVRQAEHAAPLYDFTSADGVAHTVWRLAQPAALLAAFQKLPAAYIADGHHRAAAAARVARERCAADPRQPCAAAESSWFLGVLFPAGDLRILPYHRCVRDLNGLTAGALLDAVRRHFHVEADVAPPPRGPGHIGLYLDGQWYDLSWSRAAGREDLVTSLDVSVLQGTLLGPVLGIHDPRTDRRIEFIGGIHGPAALQRRVDSGEAAAAFALYPVTTDTLMAVADAGQILPPKSTWFEPKLRDGLFIHAF